MATDGLEQLQQQIVDLQAKIDTLERTDKHAAEVAHLKDELAEKVRHLNELRRHSPIG